MEHTVPPPSPPSWAEMVRRGTTLPLGQPPSRGPASRHSPPLSAHILQLYKDCVAKGIRAKLVLRQEGVKRSTVSTGYGGGAGGRGGRGGRGRRN